MTDGQRPENHQVEEAKSGHVDANAEREHQNRRPSERWRLSQHTGRVAKILTQTIDPRPAPRLPCVLTEAQRVAEVPIPALRRHFTVKLHFVGKFPVEAATAQQVSDAAKEFVHSRLLQAVRNTAFMASCMRS